MIPIQEQIQDPFFMEMAILLGYKKQDLEVLNYEKMVQQSMPILKGKSEVEQHYYLKKKAEAYQARRQKILKEVTEQVKKQAYRDSRKRSNFNPVVTKLLKQHQIMCQKKLKYLEKVKLKKKQHFYPTHNTIDLGRTSPNFTNFQSSSKVSRKSVRSSSSRRSSVSRDSQSSQYKRRLNMVRQKDRQVQNYKKQKFLEKQRLSLKKLANVEESRNNISRKAQTRSLITNQAVREKKKSMKLIQNQEIRDHIEKLHYKVIKHEYLREKQVQNKRHALPMDREKKVQFKKSILQNEKQNYRNSYEKKMKMAELNKQKLEFEKFQERSVKNESRQMKKRYAQLHKDYSAKEEQNRKKRTLIYEMKSFENAEKKRKEIQNEKNLKIMDSRIKEELFKKNKNSLQIKRQLQNQNFLRKSQNKMNELTEIEKLKKKLIKERSQYTTENLRYGNIYQQKRNSFSFY